jgi:hypothetical protein
MMRSRGMKYGGSEMPMGESEEGIDLMGFG